MSGGDPVRALLDKLEHVKAAGAGWTARCPAHEDRKASLSIARGGDGCALVRCFAGCTTTAIVEAVGLTMRDLFMPSAGNGHSRPPRLGPIVQTYPYEDEGGVLLYQVCRYAEPTKDFRQRRPDGAGGWVWSLKGARRVLFGLPNLIDHTDVILVEGERDVLTARAIGLTATTSCGGANGWKRGDYAAQLAKVGCVRLAVLPDHDGPGRQYARDVARSCTAAGLAVKVIDLPGLQPGGDLTDWIAAGHTKDDVLATIAHAPIWTPAEAPDAAPLGGRTLRLTRASQIKVRPVRWCWQDRVARGTLALLGGREGIGKSILAYTLAADITRGALEGSYYGTPRGVIVAATEDAWEFTIVPRLIAAGANLDLVYRVDVVTSEGADTTLTLPKDLVELEGVVRESRAVLTLLDPLLSRLDASLDTHKDAEVRQALEPLVAYATATDSTVLGLIHVNKTVSTDLLTTLMGSRAFAAVARSVLIVMRDPNDEATRLLGQAKNNLGRSDLPTLTFTIGSYLAATTDEGEVWTAQLRWTGESECSIQAAAETAAASSGDRTASAEAKDWLSDYLTSQGGSANSATVKREALKAGHQAWPLREARRALHLFCGGRGFPRETWWSLPASREVDRASSREVETSVSSREVPWGDTPHTHTTTHDCKNTKENGGLQSCGKPKELTPAVPVVRLCGCEETPRATSRLESCPPMVPRTPEPEARR